MLIAEDGSNERPLWRLWMSPNSVERLENQMADARSALSARQMVILSAGSLR